MLNKFLTKRYIEECISNPTLAPQVFDGLTVEAINRIHALNEQGNTEMATRLTETLYASNPVVTYCGAGSCGLVEAGILESSLAKSLGLKGNEILKDTQRHCPHCWKKSIYYDTKYGSKACTSCSKTEIKG